MKRALLVIDVQMEYFTGKMPVTHPQGSFDNILAAMDGAAAHGIPTILVQHSAPRPESATFRRGSREWEIHEKVLAKPHDRIVEKSLPGSFTGTGLDELLRSMGVDTVVIAGYMTQMCCDTTARQALHLGYAVEFLSDATGTLDVSNSAGSVTAEELHRAILVTQQMRFSRVLTTANWLSIL
jgi:nicotinamidase-related amidase